MYRKNRNTSPQSLTKLCRPHQLWCRQFPAPFTSATNPPDPNGRVPDQTPQRLLPPICSISHPFPSLPPITTLSTPSAPSQSQALPRALSQDEQHGRGRRRRRERQPGRRGAGGGARGDGGVPGAVHVPGPPRQVPRLLRLRLRLLPERHLVPGQQDPERVAGLRRSRLQGLPHRQAEAPGEGREQAQGRCRRRRQQVEVAAPAAAAGRLFPRPPPPRDGQGEAGFVAAAAIACPHQGGVEEGAHGGHQEVQGAAPPVPAGSPAPDDVADALNPPIDRSSLFFCLVIESQRVVRQIDRQIDDSMYLRL